MGCFLACFCAPKDGKRRKQRKKIQPQNQRNTSYEHVEVQSTALAVLEYSENPISPELVITEIRDKDEEDRLSSGCSSKRKKVTFDSNVKTYEHVEDVTETHEDGKKEEEDEEEKLVKSSQSQSSSEASSITSSSGSYPPNHRYQNCRESDDELEDYEDSDLEDDEDVDDDDDEDDDGVLDYDDIYNEDLNRNVESRIGVAEVVDTEKIDSSPIGVNRIARDRSGYVNSVLNPVENLGQWKALKARGKPQLKQQKENFTLDQELPRVSVSLESSFKELSLSFKSKSDNQSKKSNQEVAVDTSLSNWLSSTETTPVKKSTTVSLNTTPEKISSQGSNSHMSQNDRPILGALTLEEIKQYSATNSPNKRSPSRSPDDMPIIGSVGSYWSHSGNAKDSGSSASSSFKGIPNTTSKYREDKKVNWNSTPFETRLERALNSAASA